MNNFFCTKGFPPWPHNLHSAVQPTYIAFQWVCLLPSKSPCSSGCMMQCPNTLSYLPKASKVKSLVFYNQTRLEQKKRCCPPLFVAGKFKMRLKTTKSRPNTRCKAQRVCMQWWRNRPNVVVLETACGGLHAPMGKFVRRASQSFQKVPQYAMLNGETCTGRCYSSGREDSILFTSGSILMSYLIWATLMNTRQNTE